MTKIPKRDKHLCECLAEDVLHVEQTVTEWQDKSSSSTQMNLSAEATDKDGNSL